MSVKDKEMVPALAQRGLIGAYDEDAGFVERFVCTMDGTVNA